MRRLMMAILAVNVIVVIPAWFSGQLKEMPQPAGWQYPPSQLKSPHESASPDKALPAARKPQSSCAASRDSPWPCSHDDRKWSGLIKPGSCSGKRAPGLLHVVVGKYSSGPEFYILRYETDAKVYVGLLSSDMRFENLQSLVQEISSLPEDSIVFAGSPDAYIHDNSHRIRALNSGETQSLRKLIDAVPHNTDVPHRDR